MTENALKRGGGGAAVWRTLAFSGIGFALAVGALLGVVGFRTSGFVLTLVPSQVLPMLAAFAAILLLPLGNIVVESGYNVLILAIAVCIVGGIGSWVGAVVAAFLIGFAQILTVVYLGAHYQMMVALLAIILTLILKPSGLFGRQKELEERV